MLDEMLDAFLAVLAPLAALFDAAQSGVSLVASCHLFFFGEGGNALPRLLSVTWVKFACCDAWMRLFDGGAGYVDVRHADRCVGVLARMPRRVVSDWVQDSQA